MTGLPLWLRIAIAVLLAASTALAFWGPAPRRVGGGRLWPRLAVLAAAGYLAGCLALVLGAPTTSAWFVAFGVEALALATWIGRGVAGGGGRTGEGDGDGVGGPGGPGGPGGWTDEDDRHFRDYAGRRPVPTAAGDGRSGQGELNSPAAS